MFHLTSTGCALVLQKDMEYWGIDELMMEPCCALKYYPEIETCVNEKQVCILVFSVANYYIVVKVNSIGDHVQVKRKVLFTFRKLGVFMLELEIEFPDRIIRSRFFRFFGTIRGSIFFRQKTEFFGF